MPSLTLALSKAIHTLQKARIETSALDAELLLAHVLKKDRTFLLTYPEKLLTPTQQKHFDTLIKKRTRHVPIAYLVGHKEFYGYEFVVRSSVLIPRSETEELVQRVIEYIKNHPAVTTLVDVGTGSGCIALTLAKEVPQLKKIYATDTSARSVMLAQHNRSRLGCAKRVSIKKNPLLTTVPRVPLIVANLPYLSQKEYKASLKRYPDMQYEPKNALLGGKTGLEIIQALLKVIDQTLLPEGAVFLEIGHSQKKPLQALVAQLLPRARIEILKDSCNFDRIAYIQT